MRNQGIYKPRAKIAQGGVGGAQLKMGAGFQQPQEVKSYYSVINAAPATGNWSVISPDSVIGGIASGPGGNQRIGRSIRVLGFSLRLSANTSALSPTEAPGQPYTIDIIKDKRPNGAQATINQIYSTVDRTSFPNPNFNDRFIFMKRIEIAGQNTGTSTVNYTHKMNTLVDYEGSAGTIADVETNNFLVTSSGQDSTPNFQGFICIMYVDA